jgi:hypothetical protein
LQSDANEKFVAGVEESDRSTNSACVACGEDGAEEIPEPGEVAEGREQKSLSLEVDAEVRKPERCVPNFGCEWERRRVDEK